MNDKISNEKETKDLNLTMKITKLRSTFLQHICGNIVCHNDNTQLQTRYHFFLIKVAMVIFKINTWCSRTAFPGVLSKNAN